MLTAMSGSVARVTGLAAGANDYITKPIGSKDLLNRIETVLHTRAEDSKKVL